MVNTVVDCCDRFLKFLNIVIKTLCQNAASATAPLPLISIEHENSLDKRMYN